MDAFSNKSFLINKIEEVQKDFHDKATKRWIRGFSSALTIAVIAALNSILLGLKIDNPDVENSIKIICLVLSAFISLVNFYIGFAKNKQLMVTYNNTVNYLKALKLEIEFETRVTDLTDTQARKYLTEFQRILDRTNADWSNLSKE